MQILNPEPVLVCSCGLLPSCHRALPSRPIYGRLFPTDATFLHFNRLTHLAQPRPNPDASFETAYDARERWRNLPRLEQCRRPLVGPSC